jgi:hypothetical protein
MMTPGRRNKSDRSGDTDEREAKFEILFRQEKLRWVANS